MQAKVTKKAEVKNEWAATTWTSYFYRRNRPENDVPNLHSTPISINFSRLQSIKVAPAGLIKREMNYQRQFNAKFCH